MKRKIISVIAFLCALALSFSLIACTDDGNSSQTDSTGSDTSFTKTDQDNVTLHMSEMNSELQAEYDAESLPVVLTRIRKSVVEVYSTLTNAIGAGAGVVIGNTEADDEGKIDSYILTCHHVIEGAQSVKIKTVDGLEYPAVPVGTDPDSDLCIMKISAQLPYVTFYDNSDNLLVGESVVAIGNPLGTLGGTVTKGIISATSREITVENKKMTLLQTDAAINSGNSGGGLFTEKGGYLIGIVNAGVNGNVEGLNFTIPSNICKSIGNDLITYGFVPGKYKLGAAVADNRISWGLTISVEVTELSKDGSLYQNGSGLKVGDILKSMTYKGTTYTISRSADFVSYINSFTFSVGDKVEFAIVRQNTNVNVEITIAQYNYFDYY